MNLSANTIGRRIRWGAALLVMAVLGGCAGPSQGAAPGPDGSRPLPSVTSPARAPGTTAPDGAAGQPTAVAPADPGWLDRLPPLETEQFRADPGAAPQDPPLPRTTDEYPVGSALDDVQAFLGSFPDSADRPALSNPAMTLTITLRAIDAHWAEIPAPRQQDVLALLGIDGGPDGAQDDGPATTSTASGDATPRLRGGPAAVAAAPPTAPATKRTKDCSAYEARLADVRKRLAADGVKVAPPVQLHCLTTNIDTKTRKTQVDPKTGEPVTDDKVSTLAFTFPRNDQLRPGEPCTIWINPAADTQHPLSVLAHEYWHCVQGEVLGPTIRPPLWVLEGQAEYIGWLFEPADATAWKLYLLTADDKSLYGRSYDGVGFFLQLHHLVGSEAETIGHLLTILPHSSFLAFSRYLLVPGMADSWVSSTVLGSAALFGDGWDTQPGHGLTTSLRTSRALEEGHRIAIERGPATAARLIVEVDQQVDVVVADRGAEGSARVSDRIAGGKTNQALTGSDPTVALCGPGERGTPNRCHCPNQPAGVPDPEALGSDNDLWVAVGGGAETDVNVSIRGLRIEDYCEARYPAPKAAPAGECRFLRDADLQRFNQNASLVQSQMDEAGDRTRCHIGYSPPVEAPSPTRYLDVSLEVASTAPPPLQASTPPDPVPELGKRATRDPNHADDFSKWGRKVVSSGSSTLYFPCGVKYCTLVVVIAQSPPNFDIAPIRADALEIAKILTKRI